MLRVTGRARYVSTSIQTEAYLDKCVAQCDMTRRIEPAPEDEGWIGNRISAA